MRRAVWRGMLSESLTPCCVLSKPVVIGCALRLAAELALLETPSASSLCACETRLRATAQAGLHLHGVTFPWRRLVHNLRKINYYQPRVPHPWGLLGLTNGWTHWAGCTPRRR